MNSSRSFDRAANIYDQTRPLLEPIATHGIPAILDITGQRAHILEVGAGTGRMSIPLLERGANLVGCDLSVPMLKRFQQKLAQPPIAQADATLLPFPAAHFDAVLTVHVLHLIPAWRDVLREFKRVLKPGGVYLNVRTWDSVGVTNSDRIRDFWHGWLAEHGVNNTGHVGVHDQETLYQELHSLGADVSEVEVIRFSDSFSLLEELDHFEKRVYSATWDVPDDIYKASVEALRAWMIKEYGDLDRELIDEVRFLIHVARFQS